MQISNSFGGISNARATLVSIGIAPVREWRSHSRYTLAKIVAARACFKYAPNVAGTPYRSAKKAGHCQWR
jgi:hypothetical protein